MSDMNEQRNTIDMSCATLLDSCAIMQLFVTRGTEIKQAKMVEMLYFVSYWEPGLFSAGKSATLYSFHV